MVFIVNDILRRHGNPQVQIERRTDTNMSRCSSSASHIITALTSGHGSYSNKNIKCRATADKGYFRLPMRKYYKK